MIKKYVIKFDNDNFNNIEDFISWAFINKELVEDREFVIENDLKEIDTCDIENIISFLKYYLKVRKLCDKSIKEYNNTLRKLSNNKELQTALDEFIRMNDSGKFLRAALVGIGYNAGNKKDYNYLDLAIALEVFQTSILIHDDLIDKAKVRRGKYTIPVSYAKKYKKNLTQDFIEQRNDFSNSIALCLGDMGFYLAEEIIINSYKNHKQLPEVLSYYHQTAIKTCLGEILDVTLPFKEKFYKTDSKLENKIIEVYKLKTAWYSVVGPYCLGLTLANQNKNEIKKMEELLLNIGIAFQIKDDLLGIYGDDRHLGKSTNSDIEEYKQTILYSYTMKTTYNYMS